MAKSFRLQVGKTYLFREPAIVRSRGYDTFVRILEEKDEGYLIGSDQGIYFKDGQHQGVNREFDLVQELS